MAFDASPSWSGFNYQGKVALYHTLTLINQQPVDTDFSNWSLMLEDTEDFEIIEDDISKSLHQVKAYNSESYSKYSDALLEITLELYKKNNAFGFIHTWKKIGFKGTFANLTESLKDDLRVLLSEYDSMPRDGRTLIEKAASAENGIPKIASILRTAFQGKTADEIYLILDSIHHESNDSLARLKTYIYDDGNDFCELSLINTKIEVEIKKALELRGKPATVKQITSTFHFFLGMMDEYITIRHKQKQQGEKIKISFFEVLQSLIQDREEISSEYLAFQFKDFFARKIDEYMSDEDDYSLPDDGEICNLSSARNYLLSLSPQDLWSYYRSFSPHTYLEHASNIENAFCVDENGIRYVLVKILYSINHGRSSCDIHKFKFTYRTSPLPKGNYLPTTIVAGMISAERIARRIIENPGVNELLYEIGNIIYNGTEVYEFSPTLDLNSQAPLEFDSIIREKHVEPLQSIKLIPIQTAKDALL